MWPISKIAHLSAFLVVLHGEAYSFSALCERWSTSAISAGASVLPLAILTTVALQCLLWLNARPLPWVIMQSRRETAWQVSPMSRADLQAGRILPAPSKHNQRSPAFTEPELQKERFEDFLRTGDANGAAVSWKMVGRIRLQHCSADAQGGQATSLVPHSHILRNNLNDTMCHSSHSQ